MEALERGRGTKMNYLSLFSGIEAASQAWQSLNWKAVAFSEIEPFPCAVLAHHYPETPNLGDITKVTEERINQLGRIDVVVYGFPCQDLSVAGKRKGLKDADGNSTRSGLFYTAAQIIKWSGARWSIAENVPGLLSSNKGLDFASVVGELCGREIPVPRNGWQNAGVALGPKGLVEWGILDAQYCRTPKFPRAVPQRRRRIFIIRDSGDWRSREPIFLNAESLRGNPPPRREAGERAAADAGSRAKSGSHWDGTGCHPSLNQSHNTGGIAASNQELFSQRGAGLVMAARMAAFGEYVDDGSTSTIKQRDYKDATDLVAVHGTQDPCTSEHTAFALGRNSGQENALYRHMQVRRLTPVECERLQGFPDGWTKIKWRNKPADQCPDGPRYKALGNSMAVNCMSWIGQRIKQVEALTQ